MNFPTNISWQFIWLFCECTQRDLAQVCKIEKPTFTWLKGKTRKDAEKQVNEGNCILSYKQDKQSTPLKNHI